MSENESKGLGDKIAKLTKATAIDKLVHAVVEDCGCEDRQKKLNEMFPGRNVKMSEQDVEAWKELLPVIERGKKGYRMNRNQTRAMYDIYNRTFNAAAKPCNCSGKNRDMVQKLERAYELRCES